MLLFLWFLILSIWINCAFFLIVKANLGQATILIDLVHVLHLFKLHLLGESRLGRIRIASLGHDLVGVGSTSHSWLVVLLESLSSDEVLSHSARASFGDFCHCSIF